LEVLYELVIGHTDQGKKRGGRRGRIVSEGKKKARVHHENVADKVPTVHRGWGGNGVKDCRRRRKGQGSEKSDGASFHSDRAQRRGLFQNSRVGNGRSVSKIQGKGLKVGVLRISVARTCARGRRSEDREKRGVLCQRPRGGRWVGLARPRPHCSRAGDIEFDLSEGGGRGGIL